MFFFFVQLIHEYPTTEAVVEVKPPVKVNIERMHLLRQFDGQILIQTSENKSSTSIYMKEMFNFRLNLGDPAKTNASISQPKPNSDNADLQENERLRSELNAHKKEITVLRGERDSLMKTIANLDVELTQAENQRITQKQQQQQSTGKKLK
jgi:septal ring factor EnvC (AmiA/AmiB activator)